MSKIPLVDLKAAYAKQKEAIDAAIKDVIDNTRFIQGKDLFDFEAAYASFSGTKHAIGVGSGTAALHLALAVLDVGPGDEVAVPAQSFIATAEPISWLGAKPRFVEVDPDTGCMDPDALKATAEGVKAIMPVHLFGRPANMAAIAEIAASLGVPVVEDAAQAQGAEIIEPDGRVIRAGGYGDIGCFSFFPGKNLGSFGDAGAITTNNDELAAKMAMLRNHGRTTKYEHVEVGYAHRMDTLQAAILGVKLTVLDEGNKRRRELAADYTSKLAGVGDLIMPVDQPMARSIYHLYVVRSKHRDALLDHLKAQNIEAGVHYPIPMHLQPAYGFIGHKPGDFPVAEAWANDCLSLPIYPELTTEQLDRVVAAVREYFDKK
ncbi:MAG TPA: erythromycin biosynthesis sensory transduction protein eryC1 [Micromonosporaceae bacterium]|nr:erythromycin biosynthesis sensory transduction protein eryC1 [Micromonosporaceae bacterium]